MTPFPHYAVTKSIRKGMEVFVPFSSSPQSVSPASSLYSSRTLQVSSEEGNSTASELLDSNSSESSYKMTLMKGFRNSQKGKKGNRLKRQMGMAAEIALIAPALQTMGCIPKFFCGMNSKPPEEGTSAINDLAYLIRVAMLDDDDIELEEPLFTGNTNNRGKDGLNRKKHKGRDPVEKIKDDLIIENLAEEELIQEDPANLPFVWQDMEHRIKVKTKPGNKHRFDDEIMDALILEPEQSSMTAILTGLKSVFRIGRSVDQLSNGNSSQVSPRSITSKDSSSLRQKRQRWRRQWKRPFWKTPKFRQDMELAQRIGKTDQDETKCSSTFNLCPYSVHEMMEIVNGGYKRQKKKKPQWFLNAEGVPESSEEEVSTKKPFKDKENLMTTTTEKTQWHHTDPEHQILYSVFPHKAIEKGLTTLRTTRRPSTTKKPDVKNTPKKRRKKPTKIQHHVEYENEDDDSSKELDPEQMDMAIHNKRRRKPWNGNRPPPQGPHHPQHGPGHFQQHRVPQGRRPLLGPQSAIFGKQNSKEDISNDDNENDKSSSEEHNDDKPKRKNAGNSSPEDEVSSEEATQKEVTSSPPPPAPQQNTQNSQNTIMVFDPQQSSQNLQQFLQNSNPIALPRPKYSLQRKQKKKQKGKQPQISPVAQNQAEKEKKDDKSSETSDEDEAEGDEESQENSSEEVKNTNSQPSPPPTMSNNAPHFNHNNLRGRPSEEIKGPAHNLLHNTPHFNPNNLRGRPSEEIKGPAHNLLPNTPQSSFEEDDPEDSDEKQNSNSGSFEGSKEQDLISMELAKVPKPARPPPPHFRMNGSNEYAYSDENGRPQLRPISYSYFKPPPGQNGGGPPSHPPPGNEGPQEPPPQTTTQKYSTGFLNFFFGKNKDKSKRKPGSFENQHRPPPPQPDESREENADDDEDDDDSEEGNDNRRRGTPQQFTAPDGKFEMGHLGNKPPPFKPDFKPPQKPQRPYRGSTSMEDSDEKKFRSTASPPPPRLSPPQTTPKPTELPRPILFIGKPHRIVIPPPATPPPSIQTTTNPTSTTTTPKSKDSEEDDEPESDEEKQSEESKEDDASKESEEEQIKKKSTTKRTKVVKITKKSTQKKQEQSQLPPVAHYKPATSTATPITPPKPSTTQSTTKTRSDSSDEKQDDDSNQTKEDDSLEDKGSKEDDASDEASSEEDGDNDKIKKRPSRPQRKPEDDELDNAPVLPPLPPVIGDVAVLGNPTEDDENPEDIVPYNPDEDIPAPPPLVQGFATSLEILVPSNAPPILPSNAVAQQAPSGVANQLQAGAPSNGATSAGGNGNPSEQIQGVRNPGSSSSNSRPNSGNRNPGNNKQQKQEQKPKEKEGEDKKKENSSEKKENSSEEKDKSSEESSEEDFAKGVLSGFDFDSISLGPENQDEENEDTAGKNPPEPPPVFTGSPSQKQQLKQSANQHRPALPHSKPHFYRPNLSRNEAILQQQQHSNPQPLRLPLQHKTPPNRPSFSVSHLLRPLMTRPVYQRKPLDPKVVEWIRESYGIPDVNHNNNNHNQRPPHMQQPNRSGLENKDVKRETTAKSSENKSKERKKKITKTKPSKKSSVLTDKSESGSESKLTSEYITEEKEAEMAQALFTTSEEDELMSETKSASQKKSGERRKHQTLVEKHDSSLERRKHISSVLMTKPSSSEKEKHSTSSEKIKPSSLEILMTSFAGKESSTSAERRKQLDSSERIKPSAVLKLTSKSAERASSSEKKKQSSTERTKSISSELSTTTKKSSFELRDRLNLSSSVETRKVASSKEKPMKSSSAEKRKSTSSEVKHKTKAVSSERRKTSSNEKLKTPSPKPIITSPHKIVIKSKSVINRSNQRPSFPGLPPIYGKQKVQGFG
ncbi:unnamed protein product [Orchesella dallaii]|uniref:Uncharacterized protein n=1 Tax=Orchesella dallaii TaxID=48710 RepID=A0ABP1Q6Y6_9HEXA